jgi:hypothetical protein
LNYNNVIVSKGKKEEGVTMRIKLLTYSIIVAMSALSHTALCCKLWVPDGNKALSEGIQHELHNASEKLNNQLRKHFIGLEQTATDTSSVETMQKIKRSHHKIWQISQELYAYCRSIGCSDQAIKNHESYVLRCCLELQ